MSDLETLTKENEELKRQFALNSQGVQGLLAQLDAHKQSLNEALNINLQLRTNLILFQKQNQEFTDQIKNLTATNKALYDENSELKKPKE
jgi:phosphate starvation-inducible protein PhoH